MRILFIFTLLMVQFCSGQISLNYQKVYEANPLVPKGLLHAVAHTNTRFTVIDENTQASCSGMPLPYGFLGLFDNGANYFRENGALVAQISGISIQNQKANPQEQLKAYAKAFNVLMQLEIDAHPQKNEEEHLYAVLGELSEIPTTGIVNRFALDAQLLEIVRFLNDPQMALAYQFEAHNFDYVKLFGEKNYQILSGKKVQASSQDIQNESGKKYQPNQSNTLKSIQYAPAIWNPAPTCNFSSRSGVAVSAITIHTIQGSYAGAISWSQNCSSSVSYHYVIRSSDGQITQMVDEANKAWHVGSENPYTIGYEHEGYVDNPVWYTEAMYTNSAALSRDIVNSGYGIPALRTYYGASSAGSQTLGGCTKIKGHQHYPSQTHTDPGINWNWEKYYRLINNNPTINTITASTDNFYDAGGASGSYTDDERTLWLFQPTNASSVTLNFSAFNIESGYDKLFIYDGATINSTLIGVYTGTNSPGIINSSGASLLVEFRSDCGTVAAGWAAVMTSTSSDDQDPTTSIVSPAAWQTEDFNVSFNDADNIGVVGRYYLVADQDPVTTKWSSNGNYGFCNELFSWDDQSWNDVTGTYSVNNGVFEFTNTAEQNSNTYYSIDQNNNSAYLYEWNQTITSTLTNQRAGLHFFCDNPTLPNRGNSYFVFFRETEQKAQIYKVEGDVFNMKTNDNCVVTANTNYTYKVTYNPQSGWIKVYSDDVLVTQWQDIEPLQSGNSISLRSGGCSVNYDNVRVFRSRGSSAAITIGPSAEMRYQSQGAVASGAIRSMVVDEIGNWSNGVSEIFLIDWTEPEIAFLNDGYFSDIDTNWTLDIAANWIGEDIHSSIASYEIAIGILPSLTNVLNWTSIGTDQIYSHILSNPQFGEVYHVSVRVVNGAGLDNLFVSNGQLLLDASTISLEQQHLNDLNIYPNPASSFISIEGLTKEVSVFMYDMNGKLVRTSSMSPVNNLLSLQALSKGYYQVIIRDGNYFKLEKLLIQE
jgi:N-acetyl-anhydromuramyl-L-alanine amidase AmpD